MGNIADDDKGPSKSANTDSYEVGYGRPPKTRQFKPGRSGNPKGRSKGSRNMKTDLNVALKARMRVTKDGRAVSMSTQQVLIAKLIEQSLKGDIRSLSKLFDLVGTHLKDEEEATIKTKALSKSDTQILEDYRRSLTDGDNSDV
ncbi:MAG: DUF5681 domain-containing protein [Litorimonas sp.]